MSGQLLLAVKEELFLKCVKFEGPNGFRCVKTKIPEEEGRKGRRVALRSSSSMALHKVNRFQSEMDSIRAGDWVCLMCNELNFSSRQVCRKCSTVRPELLAAFEATYGNMHSAMLGVVGAGAGTNSSHGGGGGGGGISGSGHGGEGGGGGSHNEQELAHQAMMQIQAFKAMQEQLQAAALQHSLSARQQAISQMLNRANAKPGDWFCPACAELNFASRQMCRKCNSPHPPFSDPTIGTKPGDWFCPTCQDLNFASRTACRKCSTPHPAGMDPAMRMMYVQAQLPSNIKPGDWHCPSCAHLNFASRNSCRQCSSPRSTASVLGIKPGDWFCSQCNDLNFASRTHCRKCSAARSAPQQQPE